MNSYHRLRLVVFEILRIHLLVVGMILVVGAVRARGQTPPGPGPEHAALKRLEGVWLAKVKGPDGDSQGAMTCRMGCGGLWLTSEFSADLGGLKFEGRGMDGYDPVSKKHVSVWVDSMSTRPLFFEGTYDPAKKVLVQFAEGPGPDGKPAKFRSETRYPDDDHQLFSLFQVTPEGKELKVMTIEYTRKR